MMRGAGVPVTRSVTCHRGEPVDHPYAYPVFVKPARLGSSVGISKVASDEELASAVQLAFEHDDKVLVEEAVTGIEVECGVLGNETPTIGITTNRCMGFIAENFLPHQIIDTTQPEINWPGMKFDKATITMSQYCPGADGVNDDDLGNYNAANETFWWLNFGPQGDDAYIRLYIAQSRKFAFGFTGFKPAQGNTKVAGQVLAAVAITGEPRYHQQLYGITS
jgi:hypothetical protein